jgi:hypothetical protein
MTRAAITPAGSPASLRGADEPEQAGGRRSRRRSRATQPWLRRATPRFEVGPHPGDTASSFADESFPGHAGVAGTTSLQAAGASERRIFRMWAALTALQQPP